jgi:hypothetical protein
MKSQNKSPLLSFERIARAEGHGIILVGAGLLALWLGGHSVLYRAYRFAAPAMVAAPPTLAQR